MRDWWYGSWLQEWYCWKDRFLWMSCREMNNMVSSLYFSFHQTNLCWRLPLYMTLRHMVSPVQQYFDVWSESPVDWMVSVLLKVWVHFLLQWNQFLDFSTWNSTSWLVGLPSLWQEWNSGEATLFGVTDCCNHGMGQDNVQEAFFFQGSYTAQLLYFQFLGVLEQHLDSFHGRNNMDHINLWLHS